ncbi:ATP-binding protein [Streptomyces sp. NPDC059063]|uniref:ATP-binding protein n=1 Tax=unclassified Streptomyces TaxID=2593676 RepID=UPI00369D2065
MKQSAAKTLGVAALGAAFAAAAAGAASAAPAVPAVPDATGALGSLSSTLPLDQAAKTLPVGGVESLAAGQNALENGLTGAQPTLEKVLGGDDKAEPADDQGEDGKKAAAAPKPAGPKPADPVGQLLGGLPTGPVATQGLPTSNLGLPL